MKNIHPALTLFSITENDEFYWDRLISHAASKGLYLMAINSYHSKVAEILLYYPMNDMPNCGKRFWYSESVLNEMNEHDALVKMIDSF